MGTHKPIQFQLHTAIKVIYFYFYIILINSFSMWLLPVTGTESYVLGHDGLGPDGVGPGSFSQDLFLQIPTEHSFQHDLYAAGGMVYLY